MKFLLGITLGLSAFFSTATYAGININSVVAQFKQTNPQFKGFQLPLKSENPPYAIGDANKDKIEDVMFYITSTNNPKSQSYLVLMKGLGNNKFKTLVINSNILSTSNWINLHIMDNSYSITLGGGGYADGDGPAEFSTIILKPFKNDPLIIKEISFHSYWETESATPNRNYEYDFSKYTYSESWGEIDYIPELKDRDWVTKTDEGKFTLKNGQKYLYFRSTTNPFKSSTDFKSDYVLSNIIKKRQK